MKHIESFLSSSTPNLSSEFKNDIWMKMEKRSIHPRKQSLFIWKGLAFTGVLSTILSLVLIVHMVHYRQSRLEFQQMNQELNTLEHDMLQDPVISDALQTVQ